jgi:hypothetical protein
MTPRGGAEPARSFYGWWVALVSFVIVLLSAGLRFTVACALLLIRAGGGRSAPSPPSARRDVRPVVGGR